MVREGLPAAADCEGTMPGPAHSVWQENPK